MWKKNLMYILVVVLAIAITFTGCTGSGSKDNGLPKIDSFAPAKGLTVKVNEIIEFSVKASDPDNDNLGYVWSQTGGGNFTKKDGAKATWQAPDSEGEATVKVTVSDGKGGIASHQWEIKVFKKKNEEETIHQVNITAFPAEAGKVTGGGSYSAGSQVTITAEAFEGYKFINWTEAGQEISTELTYSFMIEQDRDLVANFAINKVIHFECSNLESAVRTQIYNSTGRIIEGELTEADVVQLTELNGDYSDITSLKGIEHLHNLEELYIYNNRITDLSPLTNLTKLTKIWAAYNQIGDLKSIEQLVKLEDLILFENRIHDLSPLAGLTELYHLDLTYNKVIDLNPLANLSKMQYLYLCDNQISDLDPLANLTELWTLDITSNQVENVEPLANLTNLRYLFLDNNQIREISALSNLTNLLYLWLACNQIEDITPVAGMTELTELHLSNNSVSELGAISNLHKLEGLLLAYNYVEDLAVIENLITIKVLNLVSNRVDDLRPLVANSGFGPGVRIALNGNPLDLSSGSQNKKDIETLIERGVEVYYDEQEEYEEYHIEGYVYDSLNRGIEDVCVWFWMESGGAFGVYTDQNGYWSNMIQSGMSYKIVPEKEDWYFNPPVYNLDQQENNLIFVGYPNPYSLEIELEGQGRVMIEADEQTSDGKYPPGTKVSLNAVPKKGWQFKEWIGDLTGHTNPVELFMDGSKEITAIFELMGESNLFGQIEVEHKFIPPHELGSMHKTEFKPSLLAPTAKEEELIVMFDNSVDFPEQKRQLQKAGYNILRSLEPVNAHLVSFDCSLQVAEIYDSLSSLPGTLSVEPNYVRQNNSIIPNDPIYPNQRWHYQLARLPQAWEITTGTSSIRIAVLDTGVDSEHPDLRDNLDLVHAYDFINDKAAIYDVHGHGTHVAGTIGAVTDNAMGVAGIMWDVEILPLKVLDDDGYGSDFAIANALLYAAGLLDTGSGYISPVQVANMSLGGPGSSTLMEVVTRQVNAAGVIMVAASGNDDTMIDYPAAYDDVISVGAVDIGFTGTPHRAWYSNYGEDLDLVAPGGWDYLVYSTAPGGKYERSGGTSMASPHVAGIIGLMLANGIHHSEVVETLRRTSMSISGAEHDPYYGYGLINAYWAVCGVEDLQVIVGQRECDAIHVVEEVIIGLKGDQLQLPVLAGEYQVIAWIDVNGNDLIDAGDYYAESELYYFAAEEEYEFAGVVREIDSWQELDEAEKGIILIP